MEGLIFGGAYLQREIDWAYLIVGSKFTVIPQNYRINISTAFGLTQVASKNYNQIIFCLLSARHYISENMKTSPNIRDILQYLKSTYLLGLKPDDGPSKSGSYCRLWKKLTFFSSLLLVPCSKSYKPSSTAYLKELKRHVDDNFSVICFIFHSFKYCKQCTVAWYQLSKLVIVSVNL